MLKASERPKKGGSGIDRAYRGTGTRACRNKKKKPGKEGSLCPHNGESSQCAKKVTRRGPLGERKFQRKGGRPPISSETTEHTVSWWTYGHPQKKSRKA